MGPAIAFATGTTDTYTTSLTKRATVTLSPSNALSSGVNFWNGVDVSSQYLLYSDKFSQGQSTIPLSRPTAWTTPSITDQNLLNLINTLPDRVGLPLFTNINLALEWLQNSQKYFLIKNGYENIVTSDSQVILDAGWSTSYPTSGTTWTDLSGSGNNGSLTNGPTFSSSGLGSINLDGTNDYIPINPYTPSNSTQITIDIWTKPDSTTQKTTLVSKWGSSNQNNFSWLLFLNWFSDGYIYFLVGNSTGNSYEQYAMEHNLSTSVFSNLTITFSSGNVRLYRNGQFISSNTGSITSLKSVSTPLTIGADWDGSSVDTLTRHYDGLISQVKIYSKALSAQEIYQNYLVYRSRYNLWGQSLFSGNTQYFDFTKTESYSGSGSAMNDLSGNGYNATIYAGSLATIDNVRSWNCTTDGRILTDTDFTFGNDYTIFLWSRALSDSDISDWRTLLRTTTNDHPLIIQDGTDLIGYYDNDDGGNFVSYGITLASTGIANRWGLFTLVGSSGTSQKLYINEGTTNATVNYSATGEKQDAWGAVAGASQQFGYVANCITYNDRAFTADQVAQYFNATKQYFGYAPNNTITNGLVMSLDAGQVFSYPTTGDTWTDLTNNTNNVTLYNGPSFSATNGGYILFDGTNDYGLKDTPTGANFNVTNAITADAWIYYSPSDFDFWFTGTVGTAIKYRFGTNSSGNFYWDMGQHVDRNFSSYVLPSNTWNYVVFTGGLESGTIITRVYSNNVLRTTYDEGISTLPSVNKFYVGVGESPSAHPFNGRIAVLRIYDRVLTTGEITLNFNAQKARFGL